MKKTEKPIIFSTEMVRAILDGRKTQTRRVIKPQPPDGLRTMGSSEENDETCAYWWFSDIPDDFDPHKFEEYEHWYAKCPYGTPGTILWVRETFDDRLYDSFVYRADYKPYKAFTGEFPKGRPQKWRPSIHMPREAARLFLEVQDIRVERVQDISAYDACYEGAPKDADPEIYHDAKDWFRELWNDINADRGFGWEENPWVWVLNFRRCEDGQKT